MTNENFRNKHHQFQKTHNKCKDICLAYKFLIFQAHIININNREIEIFCHHAIIREIADNSFKKNFLKTFRLRECDDTEFFNCFETLYR